MKNWKTTLVGAAIGVAYFILTSLQNGMSTKDALIGGGFVLLGLISKDFDVTGTKQTDKIAESTNPILDSTIKNSPETTK